jgi:membrane-associated phospholipid phosphatase
MSTAPIHRGVVLRRVILACLLVLAGCLILVMTQRTGTGSDRYLFDLVIDNRGQFIVDLARFFVPLGEVLPLAALAALCAGSLFLRGSDLLQALLAPVSLLLTGMLVWILKHVIDRPGPSAQLRGFREIATAFPSGHAALSAAVLVAIGLVITADVPISSRIRRGSFMVCAFLAAAVSWSTVALHMHWPTDAIGGSALGAAVACALLLGLHTPRFQAWLSARRGVADSS